MSIKESGEMYLEAIYTLRKTSSLVRLTDIAEHMGFSKPSVSRGMGILKKDGLIAIDEAGDVRLTSEGQELAETIYERHTVLSQVLISLGVEKETAEEDACKIEHVISKATFDAIKKHINENK